MVAVRTVVVALTVVAAAATVMERVTITLVEIILVEARWGNDSNIDGDSNTKMKN